METARSVLFAAKLLVGLSVEASAGATCNVLVSLRKVESAAQQVAQAQGEPERKAARVELRDRLGVLSPVDFLSPGLRSHRDELTAFVESRRAVSDSAGKPELGMTYRAYADPVYWLIHRNHCNTRSEVSAPETSGISRQASLVATGIAERRWLGAFSGRWVALIIAMSLVTMLVAGMLLRRRAIRKMRRAERFACRINVRMRDAKHDYKATMHDVSQVGGKFEIDVPFGRHHAIAVKLLGEWRPGRVIWCNRHYVGLELLPAISRAEVRQLVGRPRRRLMRGRAKPASV